MNDLDMRVAMAKLNGDGLVMSACGNYVFVPCGGKLYPYNPITDLALNCALRDKYKVEIDYICGDVSIYYKDADNTIVIFDEDVNKAVVKCILKANGLYK